MSLLVYFFLPFATEFSMSVQSLGIFFFHSQYHLALLILQTIFAPDCSVGIRHAPGYECIYINQTQDCS